MGPGFGPASTFTEGSDSGLSFVPPLALETQLTGHDEDLDAMVASTPGQSTQACSASGRRSHVLNVWRNAFAREVEGIGMRAIEGQSVFPHDGVNDSTHSHESSARGLTIGCGAGDDGLW